MLSFSEGKEESFSEMVQNAKKLIPGMFEEWTDYNEHDPGITLIQLLAWLQEMQRYHLNQIGQENRLKFLRLLGGERLHSQPARCLIQASNVTETTTILKGSKLYGGGIPFETEQQETLLPNGIAEIHCVEKNQITIIEQHQMQLNGRIMCYPFGEKVQCGNQFYLGFCTPLPRKKRLRIYVDVADSYEVIRNPIRINEKTAMEFENLAKLQWQYYTKEGWKEINVLADETFHFLQDGSLFFKVEEQMEEKDGKYWIRAVLLENQYDIPPIIERIRMNMMMVCQKNTRSQITEFFEEPEEKQMICSISDALAVNGKQEAYIEDKDGYKKVLHYKKEVQKKEVILTLPLSEKKKVKIISYDKEFDKERIVGTGDGFPYQEFDIKDKNFLYETIEIMTKDEEKENFYYEWKKVTDFHNSSPSDRHYIVDEENGKIYFGDCECGMAPEGEIYLVSFASSIGFAGNVKREKINFIEDSKIEVTNYDNAAGGRGLEGLDESFQRVRMQLKERHRAITLEDFQELGKKVPGLMVKNCKALSAGKIRRQSGDVEENTIVLVIEPFSFEKKPGLSCAYQKNIQNFLQERCLIGTKIKILPPEYCSISFFGEITVKPHYIDARERIEECLKNYFKTIEDQFGKKIKYSTLYGIIDTLSCVSQVNSITLNAKGSGVGRTSGGDVILPSNGLAVLASIELVITLAA